MSDAAISKTPWHLWAVGVLGLLWNSFGCYDYYMTQTAGDAYLTQAGMSAEQIAFAHNSPAWMTAVWAIGVWGALAGTVLLLMKNKLALPVFIVSLAAYVLSVIYSNFINPMPGVTTGLYMMQFVIFAGCVFFAWYANFAKKRGIIR